MKDVTDKIIATTWAECPDHPGSHLYRRQDEAGIFWACPHGCDPLSDQDVWLEWNETHGGMNDGTDNGLSALLIIEFAPADY